MFKKERLRALRTAKGWSQRELAEKSGVSLMAVSNIELGHNRPSGRVLEKLAAALEVSVPTFYDEGQSLIVQIHV